MEEILINLLPKAHDDVDDILWNWIADAWDLKGKWSNDRSVKNIGEVGWLGVVVTKVS